MSYTTKQLQEVLKQVHNPSLAKMGGMVYQVWEDGEITSQKSGDLLWQRTLHCLTPGLHVKVPPTMMPETMGEGHDMHGYAFVTEADAKIVRNMIEDLEDRPEWNPPPKPINEGPLNILTYHDRAIAERVREYLVKEFPMCRDGKIEVIQPTEGYWANKGVWQIQFPNGHDHWATYKNTLDKIYSAAGDFIRGYDMGYKQGQRDIDHQRYLEMSTRQQTNLRKNEPLDLIRKARAQRGWSRNVE